MKNRIGLVVVLAISMFSCNQSPDKEVKDANEHLKQADQELEAAKVNKEKAAKAKTAAEWKAFKKESDSLIALAENDLVKLEAKLAKASEKNAKKLKADYTKAENDLSLLKDKLRERNKAFGNEVKKFDQKVTEKNESFKREFKHDMDELMQFLEDLFRDNVK
jgi:hypothetical protein